MFDALTMLAMLRSGQVPNGAASSEIDDYTGLPYPPNSSPFRRTAMSSAPVVAPSPEKKSGPYDLVSDDERRRARGAGLMQAGIGLLSTAGTGDYTTGIARAFQGFGDASRQGLQAAQDRARQAGLDERQARQDALQEELARSAERRQEGAFAHQQGEWNHEDKAHANRAKAAQSMTAVIDQEAGPDSPESRRAHALAELGEDADLNRLAELHAAVVARKRLPEDEAAKNLREIADAKARIAAGVAPNPAAAERRADEGMRLEAQRANLYGEQVRKQLDRDPKPVTPQQLNDDVASEAQRIYQQKLDAMKLAYGDGKPRMTKDAAGRWSLEPAKPFNGNDLARIRKEAEQEALVTVRKRYLDQRSISTGAGIAPGVYRFDAQGNLLPQ